MRLLYKNGGKSGEFRAKDHDGADLDPAAFFALAISRFHWYGLMYLVGFCRWLVPRALPGRQAEFRLEQDRS